MINILLVRGQLPCELASMKIIVCPKLILSFLVLVKMSAALIGSYDFDAWDISCEFMTEFMNESRSSGNQKAQVIERENCKILGNIQSSFHSAVKTFTALERKCDETVGTIKSGWDERRLWDHIVRIIILLMR